MANRQYEHKKEAVANALREHRWNSFLFLHERPYRLDAFSEIVDKLTNKEYWELLGDIWTDTENYWQNADEWCEFFSSIRPERKYLMSTEERSHLRSLPDPMIIHRGFSVDGAERGLSWTTSLERASWFAYRLTKEGEAARVATMTVDKDQIIAYFSGRGEDEVIVLPDNHSVVTVGDA